MKPINALVLTGYGLNCDHETAHALELAGARALRVHINSLIDGSASLDDFQIMVFIGGFSWGDDHGAGVVQAVRMRTHIGEALIRFIERGNLVMGVCNGFQTLVNLGLLPGFDNDYQRRSVALIANDCGNFRDDWVHLRVNPDSPCVFTKGISRMELPIRHGEGKFYAEEAAIDRLKDQNQVVLQYALPNGEPANGNFPKNPNGSLNDIAGICDPTGRVFGLMPHPEAYHHPANHPDWTRDRVQKEAAPERILGNRLFENAVSYLSDN